MRKVTSRRGSLRGSATAADVIAHPRLVVSRRTGEQITRRLTASPRPTKQLRALMRGDGD